jgi:hypothetical protein
MVDLWESSPAIQYEGPAHGMNDTCGPKRTTVQPVAATYFDSPMTPGSMPANCKEGTNGSKWHDGYEDALFEEQLLKVIEEHDPAIPLFVFWGTNHHLHVDCYLCSVVAPSVAKHSLLLSILCC